MPHGTPPEAPWDPTHQRPHGTPASRSLCSLLPAPFSLPLRSYGLVSRRASCATSRRTAPSPAQARPGTTRSAGPSPTAARQDRPARATLVVDVTKPTVRGMLVVDVTKPIDVAVATPRTPTTPVVLPEKEPVSPVGVEHAPDLYRRKTRKGRSESPARSWEANNGLEDNIAGGASWLPPQPLPTKDPTPLPRRGRASTPGGRWRRTKSPTGGATLQPPSDLAVRDARPGPAIRSYSCRTSTGDDVSCDRAFALLCVTLDGAGAEGAA